MLTGWNVVHLGFDCRQRQAYYSYQICPNPRLEPIQHRIRFGLSTICTWVKRLGLNMIFRTNLTFRGPCIVMYSYNKAKEMHYFATLFW